MSSFFCYFNQPSFPRQDQGRLLVAVGLLALQLLPLQVRPDDRGQPQVLVAPASDSRHPEQQGKEEEQKIFILYILGCGSLVWYSKINIWIIKTLKKFYQASKLGRIYSTWQVVTGVRFTKVGKVLFPQVEEATALPEGGTLTAVLLQQFYITKLDGVGTIDNRPSTD